MPRFFSVRDNSSRTSGYPWIIDITVGLDSKGECPECEGPLDRPSGDLQVRLQTNKGKMWPDALGCGAYSLFIVSERVLAAWRADKVGEFPLGGRIIFSPPLPKRLEHCAPPAYFWLDGEKMLGARLDFETSGFVGVQFCSTCGRRWDDDDATYERQSRPWSYTFVKGSWNGANLFTTDLSPAAFFCTDAVMECARKHGHTNFRFIPVEAGDATWSEGIDYLGKQWPPHHPLRPSEGKTLDQWVEQLRWPAKRYEARRALLDLGKEAAPAVPALTRLLHDEDEAIRREAALLFSAFGKLGVPLGSEGEAAAREHEDWFQKTLGGQGGPGDIP
jgi:hypothetical protein